MDGPKNRVHRFFLVLCMALLFAFCSPPDDSRCGEGFVYQDYSCVPCDEVDTDSDADSDSDSDTDADSDTDTSSDSDTDTDEPDGGLPEGMGEPCTEKQECLEYEADYCAVNPMTQKGYCTITDCITDPDDCPPGYLCCDFPPSMEVPNFCATEADYKDMGSLCTG